MNTIMWLRYLSMISFFTLLSVTDPHLAHAQNPKGATAYQSDSRSFVGLNLGDDFVFVGVGGLGATVFGIASLTTLIGNLVVLNSKSWKLQYSWGVSGVVVGGLGILSGIIYVTAYGLQAKEFSAGTGLVPPIVLAPFAISSFSVGIVNILKSQKRKKKMGLYRDWRVEVCPGSKRSRILVQSAEARLPHDTNNILIVQE